jgi:hypothetical protein
MGNWGELSKPATVLIERISDAVGGIFKPGQIIRVAKAEAEAERIHAENQIQITDLQRRALHRFLVEEAKHQTNIEDITRKTIPLLEDRSTPDQIHKDWITNFFDKCRIVSDEDMQALWSRVLAVQANSPGAFSRRTVNLISDLEKSDAELFSQFCRFAWTIDEATTPLVFDHNLPIYRDNGINVPALVHLESLNLIKSLADGSYGNIGFQKGLTVFYYDRPLILEFPKDDDNHLDIGKVLLTQAGMELARVCRSKPIDGFYDFMKEKWTELGLIKSQSGSIDGSPEFVVARVSIHD